LEFGIAVEKLENPIFGKSVRKELEEFDGYRKYLMVNLERLLIFSAMKEKTHNWLAIDMESLYNNDTNEYSD
jgi:hypothetical protein